MARHTQIVEVLYEDAARFMGERMQGTETAVDRLRAYMDANLEYLRDHPRQVAALTEIGPHLPTRSGQAPTSLREQEPVLDALTSILREGQESGELTKPTRPGPRGCTWIGIEIDRRRSRRTDRST